MFRNYSFWLKAAIFFQLQTGLVHGFTLFQKPVPENETEKQLFYLMESYHPDLGAGFHPSMSDLFTALSSCLTLLCLFGGIVLWFLLRAKAGIILLRGYTSISILIFGICFFVLARFSFLPPIICMGLIWLSLLIARLSFPKTAALNA